MGKDLQKLTENKTVINDILQKSKIEYSDINHLNDNQMSLLCETLTTKVNELKGVEKEHFINKIEKILDEPTKNQLWESNHNEIIRAISNLTQKYGRMPSKTEIATETELSRQTVHKHLKDFGTNELYLEHLEQFKIMMPKVLAKVFIYAVNGDISAAKLYFNVIGATQKQSNITNQNNYIQINNTVLSQNDISKLTPEKLELLERVIISKNEEQPLFDNETDFGFNSY